MLKPIYKNHPFLFLTYGYVLLTIGGTTVMIIVIGILYYAKYKRVKASRMPNLRKIPLSKDDTELQMYSLKTTNDKVAKDLQNNPEPSMSKATPTVDPETA